MTYIPACSSKKILGRKFIEIFGTTALLEYFTPDDEIGKFVPIGKRRMSGKRELTLIDRNGERHLCVAEAFTQTHQVFVLMHSVETLARTSIILPESVNIKV